MKIKEFTSWPPRVTPEGGDIFPIPDMDDEVLSVEINVGARDHIGLQLQRSDGLKYRVSLKVPENLLDKVVVLILGRNRMPTLGAVGELEIS